MGSVPLAEVEDVLDTTEAFWAARRRDSSRVSRLTLECKLLASPANQLVLMTAGTYNRFLLLLQL